MSHTPGPWKFDPSDNRIVAERVCVALVTLGVDEACDVELSGPTFQANARLIAAAPALLEALKLLHDNLAEYQRLNHLGGYDNHDMQQARAAIQKAEAGVT